MTNVHNNILKRYLRKTRITPQRLVGEYKNALRVDVAVALLYTVVSAVLICIQKADTVILGLNILCLLRCGINNLIKSSEMANADINGKNALNRYHIKAAITFTSVVFCSLLWAVLLEYKSDEVGIAIKTFAVIIIAVVFLNDCDNSIVFAYDGKIEE